MLDGTVYCIRFLNFYSRVWPGGAFLPATVAASPALRYRETARALRQLPVRRRPKRGRGTRSSKPSELARFVRCRRSLSLSLPAIPILRPTWSPQDPWPALLRPCSPSLKCASGSRPRRVRPSNMAPTRQPNTINAVRVLFIAAS